MEDGVLREPRETPKDLPSTPQPLTGPRRNQPKYSSGLSLDLNWLPQNNVEADILGSFCFIDSLPENRISAGIGNLGFAFLTTLMVEGGAGA